MQPFLATEIFPIDVLYAIRKYMENPAASSCTDTHLLRTLKLYDENEGQVFLEYLPYRSVFLYNGSKVFQKKEKKYESVSVAQKFLQEPFTCLIL